MFGKYLKNSSIILLAVFIFSLAMPIFAQFHVKLPSIQKPKAVKTNSIQPTQSSSSITKASSRQMVMDDGYTFFDAEPVEQYDSQIRLRKDIGWYLKSDLRMLGTFPKRSAFKVVVKKNGKSLAETRCAGGFYQKATDYSLKTDLQRKNKDLNFEDFMYSKRCFNKEAVIKPTGKLDVEIHFIDGDTDAEKLVRTYKIDVRRATRVRGSASRPQPDVAHYYIQRHAEAGVAFLHIAGNYTGRNNNGARSYFWNNPATSDTPSYGQLTAYISYSPARNSRSVGASFARCSVNGQRIKLPRDGVTFSSIRRQEYAIYTDRIASQYKRGPAYREDIKFTIYSVSFPLYTGGGQYSKPPMKIEDYPGKWECQIIASGVKLRTFRWEVGSDGKILPHPEQANGNINLYYKSFLVDMEIPKGGAPFDFRLMPMPNAGLFYGIPWTSVEGKRTAASVPQKGNPFHVPSNKAK